MREGRLYELFEQAARAREDRAALTFLRAGQPPSTYTYGTLFERVAELAEQAGRGRLETSARLGILLRTQEAQAVHYLAALKAGLLPAILTPPNRKLNRAYYAETMAAVVDRCRFSAIVTDVDLDLTAPALEPFTLKPIGGSRKPGGGSGSPDRFDASFLQFSSGTTGIKRGVLVSDDAVFAQLREYGKTIALSDADVVVSWLPLYHDMGFIACLNMPLAYGTHCVMIDPIDWVTNPSLFLQAVSEYGGTLAWNPNFAYAFIAQRARDNQLDGVRLSSLRGLVNCSEPVTFESQQQFAERFTPLGLRPNVFWGCYAMAETTFALTHGTPDDPDYLDAQGPDDPAALRGPFQVSVGRPLPNVSLRVVGPDGTLPDRRIGEIWVKSPFTFSGYFNDPAASREAFSDGWYRTGDLGYRVNDAFYVVGRSKDVMIVSGVNVFPHDIEETVSTVDGVIPGRVSTFSRFDPALQTEKITILAESELADGPARQTVLTIRQLVLASFQVANFEVHLVPPGWLVKSSSGKMARRANREKWLDEREAAEVARSTR